MPELPEVETVRRGLERLVVGKKIVAVTHDTPKSFPNTPSDVEQFLISSTIVAVRRRAKVLLIDLDTDYTLVTHLKMTGQLVYVQKKLPTGPVSASAPTFEKSKILSKAGAAPRAATRIIEKGEMRWGAGHPNDSLVNDLPDKSTRVQLTFEDGSMVFFNDQRKFGWMKLYPTLEVPNIDFMQKVGPEPLEASFTAAAFIPRIRRRSGTTIKAAILDQTVLAGVGNIYADESLWAAQIHPATRVANVTNEQLAQLLAEIKAVMNLSIELGGSSNHTYRDAEGRKGSYMQFANVFRREGLACPRHPDVLIEKIRVAGRGTHICPVCQHLDKQTLVC